MIKLLTGILLIALLCAPAARAEENSPPEAVIGDFLVGLSRVLEQAQESDPVGRAQALCPVLTEAMNIKLQGAASIGTQTWNSWSQDQKMNFSAQFHRYLCAAYADRFRNYSGEAFVVVGNRPGPRGAVIVETHVQIPEEEPVSIDYVMVNGKSGWKITDLYLGGAISEVALRRAEFAGILKDQGFDALMSAMVNKVQGWMTGIPENSSGG